MVSSSSKIVDHWTRAQAFEKKKKEKESCLLNFFRPSVNNYKLAADSYKLAGYEKEAGLAYKYMAFDLLDTCDAADAYVEAANCFKHCAMIKDAIYCLEEAAKILIKRYKICKAAGCYEELAEVYKQNNQSKLATATSQKAVNLYQSVGVSVTPPAADLKPPPPPLITWLPPLNSHRNSHVTVHAVQRQSLEFNLHKRPQLSLVLHVDAVFQSSVDLNKKPFPALSILLNVTNFPILKDSVAMENKILDLLCAYVPFTLDKVYYNETRLFVTKPPQTKRNNIVTIIKQLSNFLKDIVWESKGAGFAKVQAEVTVTKWIKLSANELEVYNDLYEEQDKEEYMKAISRPRTLDELFEDITLYKTVAEKCEDVNYVKNRKIFDKETCCVCWGKLHGGAKSVRKMSCSHVFHEVCILRWLKTSMCPLCRYMLAS